MSLFELHNESIIEWLTIGSNMGTKILTPNYIMMYLLVCLQT